MSAPVHALVLTSIAIAIFALVMAYGWVGIVERRLTALESAKPPSPTPKSS